MNILHDSHPGIVRIKGIARRYVWWPKMDALLEEQVKNCQVCQAHRKTPAPAALHPWEWPSRSWTRIHIDYAGPFMGKMFLLIIDAHSKWLDVHWVSSATTETTLEKLRTTFATHGLPEVLVSDNGSVFTSEDFKVFTRRNGIRHVTSAPYHPSSNGLVERAVQIFKQGMKKQDKGSIETKLARFLLSYRTTPQTTTGETPAQLRWSRALRTQIDLLKPSVATKVDAAQARQKNQHDQHSKSRPLCVGDEVQARNYSGNRKWIAGTIVKQTGPVSAQVELGNGTIVRRHRQLLARQSQSTEQELPPQRQSEVQCEDATHGLPQQGRPASEAPVEETELVIELPRRYPVRRRFKLVGLLQVVIFWFFFLET